MSLNARLLSPNAVSLHCATKVSLRVTFRIKLTEGRNKAPGVTVFKNMLCQPIMIWPYSEISTLRVGKTLYICVTVTQLDLLEGHLVVEAKPVPRTLTGTCSSHWVALPSLTTREELSLTSS